MVEDGDRGERVIPDVSDEYVSLTGVRGEGDGGEW